MPKLRDVAILYRYNAQAGPIQKALSAARIPYVVQGGMGFWKQREVKDIIAFLSWMSNPLDRASLDRASKNLKLKANKRIQDMVFPNLKVGDTLRNISEVFENSVRKENTYTIQFRKILRFAIKHKENKVRDILKAFYHDFSIIQALAKEDAKGDTKDICREDSAHTLLSLAEGMHLEEFLDSAKLSTEGENDESQDAVVLSTIHKSKGLEYDFVIVVGCTEGILPGKMTLNEIYDKYGDDISQKELEDTSEFEQELNCMYVAETRAKRFLMLTHSKLDFSRGPAGASPRARNRFMTRSLEEIEKNGKVSILKERNGMGSKGTRIH